MDTKTVAIIFETLALVIVLVWFARKYLRAPRGPRECNGCTHFDLEEGQAAIAEQPAFQAATQHVSPAMMGRRRDPEASSDEPSADEPSAEPDASEQAETPDAANAIPASCKWTDFGACGHEGQLRWRRDVCAKWERGS